MTRRRFAELGLGLAAAAGTEARASGRDGIAPEERAEMAREAEEFRRKWDAPGLSVAIAYRGRMVYCEGFGVADPASRAPVTPQSLFRIASVSKPFTSATIFRLIESGKLTLSDRVFGKEGLLDFDIASSPSPERLRRVTLHHLLTHTAGGWQNNGSDPMFAHPEMSHAELIAWTLRTHPLAHDPGEHYAYSNFGYCVLGRVIERVTTRPYAEAVRRLVLSPCGITQMRIAGNRLEERAPHEVVYAGQSGENPYNMNVARMDSHGGWLASPTDLVRFLVRVDGFPTKPDILNAASIREMTTPTATGSGYACGWQVNLANNWWHIGSLPGTTTVMVRTSGQLCWAALTSTRRPGSDINGDIDRLPWAMVNKVTRWPDIDLL
jgi:CubicO group peptidase (beta-lactamase class C family)